MKRTLHILTFAVLLTIVGACTPVQRQGDTIPVRVLGVYRPYIEEIGPLPDAPDGYEVVYISHYGRHGSRYHLYDTLYTSVGSLLARFHEEGLLTPAGEKLHAQYSNLYPQFEGRAGLLTDVGREQHRDIARRMAKRHQAMFRNGKVKASTSATSRTEESMKAFCAELRHHLPGVQIAASTDPVLNPYSSATGLASPEDLRVKSPRADWRADYEAFARRTIDTEPFAGRLFTDTGRVATWCDLYAFERAIFYLAIHLKGCGIAVDWLNLFTTDELLRFAYCDAYTFYMEKGPAPQTSDRTWALSAHILQKMIDAVDTDIKEGVAANLRFGHDGCIMAMLTLMGIEGWCEAIDAPPEAVAQAWDVSQIPMACNLQWIFYRPKSGNEEMMVRVLLNESPLTLPLEGENGLYGWDEMKSDLSKRCRVAFKILSDTNE